jgi:hypothetical protein
MRNLQQKITNEDNIMKSNLLKENVARAQGIRIRLVQSAQKAKAVKKENAVKAKSIRAELTHAAQEVASIKNAAAAPAERISRYDALAKKVEGMYDGGHKVTEKEVQEINKNPNIQARFKQHDLIREKRERMYHGENYRPGIVDGLMAGNGSLLGATAGFGIIGLVIGPVFFPAFALPVMAATAAITAVAAGAAGGIFGARRGRQELRAKYGSVRNARSIYRMKNKVSRSAGRECAKTWRQAHPSTLRKLFDGVTNQKAAAPASAPQAAQNAQTVITPRV